MGDSPLNRAMQNEVFSVLFSLGFAWHVRIRVSIIFFLHVIRSSLASCRPLGSNIMAPPGSTKDLACLFLLGETRAKGTVSKHQYGAHMLPLCSPHRS